MGLGRQVGQWPVVSNGSGVLAINIWPPLFFMAKTIANSTCSWLHSCMVPQLTFCYSML